MWFRKPLSATLMKNCAVAEWGSLVRAIATVVQVFEAIVVCFQWNIALFFRCWFHSAALHHEAGNHPMKMVLL